MHKSKYTILLCIAFVVVILDQLTKLWVLKTIEPGTYIDPPPLPLIPGFFYIVHIYNTGAAWGTFSGGSFWLGLLAVGVIIGIVIFRKSLGLERTKMQYGVGLLLGGIIGNLIDRFYRGHVIDFLDIHLPGYRWPAFNIADSAIFLGITLYVIVVLLDSFKKET